MAHIIIRFKDGRSNVLVFGQYGASDARKEWEIIKANPEIEAAQFHSGIANDIESFKRHDLESRHA